MNYTTIEQSKALIEAGLNPETADCCWIISRDNCKQEPFELAKNENTLWLYPMDKIRGNLSDYMLPCWSLAALLDNIPQVKIDSIKQYNKKHWRCCAYFASDWHDSGWYDNPVDACYEMILKLKELNLL